MRFLLISLTVILSSCGGGSGAPASSETSNSDTTPVTTYFPSGRIHEQGFVVTGTTTRTGKWTTYFDQDENPKNWQGNYVNDVVEQTKPWTEWNSDGSIRMDSSD